MASIDIPKPALIDLIANRFEDLSASIVEKLLLIGDLIESKDAETVIRQGDSSTDVYFLVSGRLAVYIDLDDQGAKKLMKFM